MKFLAAHEISVGSYVWKGRQRIAAYLTKSGSIRFYHEILNCYPAVGWYQPFNVEPPEHIPPELISKVANLLLLQ